MIAYCQQVRRVGLDVGADVEHDVEAARLARAGQRQAMAGRLTPSSFRSCSIETPSARRCCRS
jgi:hypothetical protein